MSPRERTLYQSMSPRLRPTLTTSPDDPGRDRRLEWADLFRRVFAQDVLVCSRCGGTMRLIAVIEAPPSVIEKILTHLGLWQRGQPR